MDLMDGLDRSRIALKREKGDAKIPQGIVVSTAGETYCFILDFDKGVGEKWDNCCAPQKKFG